MLKPSTYFGTLAFIVLFSVQLSAQYSFLSDPVLEQALIDDGVDSEGVLDGQILTSDVLSTTELHLSDEGLNDMTDLYIFENLLHLDVSNNDITFINISPFTLLEYFNCNGNEAQTVGTAGMVELTELRANGNNIDNLDLSDNTALQHLTVGFNNLGSLDVSSNTQLLTLSCSVNSLTSLDLSHCPLLQELTCDVNQLSSLDLSGQPDLTLLLASNNNLPTVDLSHNPDLTTLWVSSSGLTSINLSSNTSLSYLNLGYNPISQLDVSSLNSLQNLQLENSGILALDLSANPMLSSVQVWNTPITSVDLRNGNNSNLFNFRSDNCPNLFCVSVDDPSYAEANWNQVDPWTMFLADCGADCSAFDTAPVDLTKSFDPVNGNYDRLQVKFFKGSGQERYTVEDNAACDIEYWAYRYKDHPEDPWTQIPQAERDTTLLPYTTVKKNNGKALFKWPIKYRLNNGTNQVQPNHGYQWRVRCYCDQGALVDGSQVITPWSEVKYFNTPDFDPSTGLYIPPTEMANAGTQKSMADENEELILYPNPSAGNGISMHWSGEEELLRLRIADQTGRLVHREQILLRPGVNAIAFNQELSEGIYSVLLMSSSVHLAERLLVRKR